MNATSITSHPHRNAPPNGLSNDTLYVPMVVMGQTGLSHGARLLYGLISTIMAREGPNIEAVAIRRDDLCRPLTVSVRQLERYVNELEAAGYITATVQQGGKPSVYSLVEREKRGR